MEELTASDFTAAVTRAVPFLRHHPTRPCANLESEFATGNHLLRGNEIGWYATTWSSYQALNALYMASLLPGNGECKGDFEDNVRAIDAHYWDTSYAPAPAAFDQGPTALHFHLDPPRVDDSLWMGLTADKAYLITGDPSYLGRAKAVFQMAIGNWDSAKGGIYWENHADGGTDPEKAVVSNAPAVVLGAALYQQTGEARYLTGSTRILDWLESTLLDPRTGLYDDHVDDSTRPATIDRVKFTYNQGVVIGALAALATIDPGHYSLSDAVQLAYRSMAYFRAHRNYGQPAFDAIWGQYLLWTAGLYGNPAFVRQAQSSIDLALRADGSPPGDLLNKGAGMAFQELARMPPGEYGELSDVRDQRWRSALQLATP